MSPNADVTPPTTVMSGTVVSDSNIVAVNFLRISILLFLFELFGSFVVISRTGESLSIVWLMIMFCFLKKKNKKGKYHIINSNHQSSSPMDFDHSNHGEKGLFPILIRILDCTVSTVDQNNRSE